jgi:sialic acid synthase SpsE
MKTKIIAEIGYNHRGSIEQAKKLIDEAKKLNLWAVKFQKWDIESFPKHIKEKRRNSEHDYGETYYEHRKFLEFNIEQLQELKNYAEKKGLEFICSGKDFNSIKEIVKLNLKFIKIPSQRYHNNQIFKFLFHERKKRNFLIMASTGMMTALQIKKSRWIEEADILMHCISVYPAELNQCNLGWMLKLPYTGYSSHEKEGKAIKYAVAMGIPVIERHFTLDKKDKGSDHKISSDVKEMKRIIKEIEEIELIKGNGRRNITEKELNLSKFYKSF